MSKSEQKVVQYVNEAHAAETTLVSVLQSQIAVTPRGTYRQGLEKHLEETRDHARRLRERARELGEGSNPLQAMIGFTETVIGQSVAFSKVPLDLLRGTGGEEKVLKNAKDAAASEALEIATYTALERLAKDTGDERTAKLAGSIRADEERMLQRILREIPKLADAVVGAEVNGEPSYDVTETGAADAVRKGAGEARRTARTTARSARRTARSAAGSARQTARKTEGRARSTARQARKVPGVAQAEGQLKGAVASERDLPIARYDSLTAEEIVQKLPDLSQIDLAKVDSYERRHESRTTILSRLTTLRTSEPWPGYDELNASEIEAVLRQADEDQTKAIAGYERAHKNRTGVLRAAERETAGASS